MSAGSMVIAAELVSELLAGAGIGAGSVATGGAELPAPAEFDGVGLATLGLICRAELIANAVAPTATTATAATAPIATPEESEPLERIEPRPRKPRKPPAVAAASPPGRRAEAAALRAERRKAYCDSQSSHSRR